MRHIKALISSLSCMIPAISCSLSTAIKKNTSISNLSTAKKLYCVYNKFFSCIYSYSRFINNRFATILGARAICLHVRPRWLRTDGHEQNPFVYNCQLASLKTVNYHLAKSYTARRIPTSAL